MALASKAGVIWKGALGIITAGVAAYGLNGWKQADASLHVLCSSHYSNTDVLTNDWILRSKWNRLASASPIIYALYLIPRT